MTSRLETMARAASACRLMRDERKRDVFEADMRAAIEALIETIAQPELASQVRRVDGDWPEGAVVRAFLRSILSEHDEGTGR